MNAKATIRTGDLEATLDYLEGLAEILTTLSSERRGRDEDDDLLTRLQALSGFDMSWEPLRLQRGVGAGWSSVADNVRELRERLLGPYAEAAL